MRSYLQWLQHLRGHDDPLFELGLILPHLSIAERKVLLAVSRCQVVPRKSSRIYRHFPERSWTSRFSLPPKVMNRTASRNLFELSQILSPYMTPFFAGFISMLIRNAPYDNYESAVLERDSSIRKELRAATGKYHPETLDYDALLGLGSSRNARLVQNLPMDKDVQDSIFRCFQQSKARLRNMKIVLPDISMKSIGVEGSMNTALYKGTSRILEQEAAESTSDLEKVYARRGIRFAGSTEMRSAWKYNDLKPRVYYARGPSVYYASRYVQEILNTILDCFPMVHRFTRFETRSLRMDGQSVAFIYDYSSFTSSLHEIRNFTIALGEFYKDVEIRLLDTFGGPYMANLGDLLLTYNADCNEDPEFEVSKLLGHDPFTFLNHNCGMLGVPGNISLATLLHGVHLACLIGGIDKGKCVGDDAVGVAIKGDDWTGKGGDRKRELIAGISNIGIIEESKTEWWNKPKHDEEWDDETWQYLKRPILRIDETVMELGTLIDWPSLAIILGLRDQFHVHRWETLEDRLKVFSSQFRRFLTEIEEKVVLTEEILRFTNSFMFAAYRELGVPRGGQYPLPGKQPIWLPPRPYSGDFVRNIEESTSAMILSVPKIYRKGIDEEEADLTVGGCFIRPSNRIFSLLTRLGYMSRSIVTEEIISDESPEKWMKLLIRTGRKPEFLYEFVVVERVPEWVYALLDEAHVPHERSQHSIALGRDMIEDIHEYLS